MTHPLTATSAFGKLLLSTAMSLSCLAVAQAATPAAGKASAPGLVERAKKATVKAAHSTAEVISDTGKKIDAKVPRTEAYKKKHPAKAAAASR